MTQTRKTSPKDMYLSGFRQDAIQQIIRSDLRFTTTRYFAERWVPVLGLYPNDLLTPRRSAGQAAGRSASIITDLRQFVQWDNGKPMLISQPKLALRHNVSTRTINTFLDEFFVSWFIQPISGKYYRKNGKVMRPPNKYAVRQDEPLIPQDIENLIQIFKQRLEEARNIHPEDLLTWALDQKPEFLLAANPCTIIQSPNLFSNGPLEAIDVIRIIFPKATISQKEKLLSNRLQNHLISPKDVLGDSKHFRENWMVRLGAGAGWFLLHLRNQGYLDEEKGIERNTVFVNNINQYAKMLGVSNSQTVRWLKHDLKDWVDILFENKGSNQKIERTLQINLHNKLTPDDEEKLFLLHANNKPHTFVASTPTVKPQKISKPPKGVPQKVASTPNRVPQKVSNSPKGVPRKVADTSSRVPRKVAEIQRPSLKTKNLPDAHYHQRQSQHLKFDGDGNDALPLTEELVDMLKKMGWDDSLSIIQKKYSNNPERTIAWAKYALKKPGLKNRAGYFRKRLISGDSPPSNPKNKSNNDQDRNRYTTGKYAEFID